MRLKKKKEQKQFFIGFRVTEKEKNKIKRAALTYTEGNLSEFVLYAALNYNIKRSDLE